MVVFPLPDAPNNTNASPSPTSKEMFWSTLVLPKYLLTPATRAAGMAAVPSDFGSTVFCIARATWAIVLLVVLSLSVDVKPIARKEQHAKDQERKQRQHNRYRIRGFNLTFIKFRKDIKGRSLRAAGKITGNQNSGTKLADRPRKRKQCS